MIDYIVYKDFKWLKLKTFQTRKGGGLMSYELSANLNCAVTRRSQMSSLVWNR